MGFYIYVKNDISENTLFSDMAKYVKMSGPQNSRNSGFGENGRKIRPPKNGLNFRS